MYSTLLLCKCNKILILINNDFFTSGLIDLVLRFPLSIN